MTDANLFLGRILPSFFPAIFGPDENLPLDTEVVQLKFEELTKAINTETGRSMTPQEVAYGFLTVANESMCRPIRAITEARGFETRQHNLAVFGGAGGQHACDIASKLGIKRVIIHKHSSILSAYGIALAEVVQEAQEPSSEILSDEALRKLESRIHILKASVTESLLSQGIPTDSITYELYLNLRYNGTNTNFMIQQPKDGDWRASLEATHLRELSFSFPHDHKVIVDDVRVRGVGKGDNATTDSNVLVKELAGSEFSEYSVGSAAIVRSRCYLIPVSRQNH